MLEKKLVARHKWGLIAVAFGLLAATAFPPAQAAVTPVTVHAERGIVATAGITQLTDRGVWTFDVRLVVPQGSTVSSGAVLPSGVDMTRPWAAVAIRSPYAGDSCGNFVNPTSYSVGEIQGNRWVGAYVDVTCNDRSGYDFFRVTWPAKLWVVRNPQVFALRGVDPAQFSTPTVEGVIHAWPEFEQRDYPSLCGHRPWGAWECFGDGGGHLQSTSTGLVTAAISK